MENTILPISARLRQMATRGLMGLLVLAVLTFGQAATATAQVTITQVFVDDPVANQVRIDGSDFDNGPNLVVTLGDIAAPLVIVNPPNPNQIIAVLPAGLVAGDYLLNVTTGGGPNRQDDYDLTIGAQVAGVPANAIILWDQNNTCPAGFTSVAAFNGSFLVGGNVPGNTGGSNTHSHGAGTLAGPAHTHNHVAWNGSPGPVDDNSGGADYNNATGPAGGGAMAGATESVDGRPPFMTILLCRSP
jgi:hypothetical protein